VDARLECLEGVGEELEVLNGVEESHPEYAWPFVR
jgi:hypothetical protein